MLYSYARNYTTFSDVASALQTELAAQSSVPIEFHEASLEGQQFAGSESDESIVRYLQTLFGGRAPDLVVPLGGPAVRFALRLRPQLYPSVPFLLTAVDVRHLNPFSLDTNTTAVGSQFDGPALMDHVLQVLPGTTNIAVVLGGSALEGFWRQDLEREWAGFTNRLGFTWLNQYSLEGMREKVGHLPPHTVIFYFSMFVDAAGVPHEYQRAIKVLSDSANAPMVGAYEEELGVGIVGGPLLSLREYGRESARVALRILNGEVAGNIHTPPKVVGTPVYDWRELRRWNISEDRLPPGSTVKYRVPTTWERFRGRVIAVVTIMLVQGAIIALLLINLIRRRRAERLVAEGEKATREVSGRLITAQEDERRRIARDLHDDFNQRLAMLSIEAELLERLEEKPEAKKLIRNIADGAKELSLEVHKLSRQLHPATLDQIGLLTATELFCQELTKQSGVPIEFTYDAIPADVDQELSLSLYRLVQEGLQNILKHSQATKARVELHRHDGHLTLVISDNGCGFNPQTVSQHAGLGLVGMRERVRLVQGRIEFYSAPDKGTRIEVNVPIVLAESSGAS
jgi:signal transduction histidine kinase